MKMSKAGGKKPVASDVCSQGHQQKIPWTSRLWNSVGLPWILSGIASYTLLTMLGRQFLHNPKGFDRLREEVPSAVYDRSTSIFLTALAIDLLNIVFERQTIKVDCVLLPAFIKGMASTTNILVRFFTPVVALTEAGRPIVVQRYICWMHTTPSILMLLKLISTTITPRETLTAILFDEVMVVTGLAALVTTGWQRVLWSVLTHVAMLPVVPYMHKAFTECIAAHQNAKDTAQWAAGDLRNRGVVARAMEQIRARPLQLTMLLIYVLNLMLWCTFAVTWDLALFGWISVLTEEVLYLGCDFSAKVLFSSTLMLSSFKEFEARRENAMRVIEGSSKAKLISELQVLLEQKERFMSSVSHELRTPLNGIIGISEGMLSGCCGVLHEGVRRQIYIIRTSGARLLALINDVMDAAALRQNKLVLKQEQVTVRHVVDDVLDLTRSLVDSEVELSNLVPPRMLVMGDTGRIVQILNNLLGNAAKFTRRGQIRVTARQVEGGRKVAITVSDTGIGIPRSKLATIFLPFEQVDMSISRKYGGFGLGLNIVQELVKAHGGTINVSSIEGKGSAFTFTLPLARAMGRESLEEAKAAAQRVGSLNGTNNASSTAGPPDTRSGGSGGDRMQSSGDTGTGSATLSTATPRLGDGGADDSSTVISGSDASRRAGRQLQGAGATTDGELEQYGELMYNAAELSALASSRPYAQSVRDSLPASLKGGTSPASSLIGTAVVHAKAGSRAGKVAAAADTCARSHTSGPGDGGGSMVQNLPGGDTKIVHGPRPFHYTMYKRFLLLSVDDDPVNQSVVKSLLGSTGYEVVAVPGGAEALRYVASAPALPDLVLLDCMMPEMDGYEVLQRLRAMTPHVHVPIIMVSAQNEEEHVVCGLDLGADDYVTKPFKRNELLARVRAQLAYGEWEHDDGALGTISSLVAMDFHQGGDGGPGFSAIGGGSNGIALLESGDGIGAAPGASSTPPVALTTSAVASTTFPAAASVPGSGNLGDQRLIVCIDDDDVNQMVLQGMLTSQHYRYVRASTGAQGLSYVCGTHNGGLPPDLVLLDCSLPDMTGFDVCRCIRQMYNKQQVPIVMLSARNNESALVEGLKCGANNYVTKPFRRNELLARIRLHLRSREPSLGLSPSRGESGGEESESPIGIAAASALDNLRLKASARQGRSNASAHGMPVDGAAATVALGSTGIESRSASVAVGGGAGSGSEATDGACCSDGVRVWTEAAVLVVAVADYVGLCRMLTPSEMAELSTRMAAAFERAVVAYGAVQIEASSGVMSAAVLPMAPPPLMPTGADAETVNAAATAAAAASGLRLAALHRVGRALLEAAAMLPVPGTSTCLQLQAALALGTVMGHCTAPAAGSTMLYFGPVLAELLDLARRAPPMTMVSPDGEAQALRASGATADVRGPLFLESEDSGGGATAASAQRLWLVEAHPLAHQYLPPQLLCSSSVMRPVTGSSGVFFQRPLLTQEVDAVDKGSGSTPGSSFLNISGIAAVLPAPPLPVPRGSGPVAPGSSPFFHSAQAPPSAAAVSQTQVMHGSGGDGGGGSLLSTQPTGTLTAGSEQPHVGCASNSVQSAFMGNLGLYGHGHAPSPAASRMLSQNMNVSLDSDVSGRVIAHPHLTMSQQAPLQLQLPPLLQQQVNGPHAAGLPSAAPTRTGSGNGGSTSQASGGTIGGGTVAGLSVGHIMPSAGAAVSHINAGGGLSGMSASPSQNFRGMGSLTGPALSRGSGGSCITFNLQAATAAVAAAAAAANGSSGHLGLPHESLVLGYGMASIGGGIAGGMPSSTALPSITTLPGTSLLYGTGQRPSSNPSPAAGFATATFTRAATPDSDAMAAEPQIRALRNELHAMRKQLEALQSVPGREPVTAGPYNVNILAASAIAPPSVSPPPQVYGSQYGETQLHDSSLRSTAAFQSQLSAPGSTSQLSPPVQARQDLMMVAPSSAASTDGHITAQPLLRAAASVGEKPAKKSSKLSRLFGRHSKNFDGKHAS